MAFPRFKGIQYIRGSCLNRDVGSRNIMKTSLCLLAIAVLLATSCGRAEVTEITNVNEMAAYFNKTGAYFKKAELKSLIEKCKTSDAVLIVFGKPFSSHTNSTGDVSWTYIAPPALKIYDGVAGFSMRSSTNGEILWWEPILSNRAEGVR